jgi:hypothetical protein
VQQGRDVAKGTLRVIVSDVGMSMEELQRRLDGIATMDAIPAFKSVREQLAMSS